MHLNAEWDDKMTQMFSEYPSLAKFIILSLHLHSWGALIKKGYLESTNYLCDEVPLPEQLYEVIR